MAADDYSTSSEEHQETRGPEAHPDYRTAVRQSALGILDHSYITGCLGQVNVKQGQPILNGLQCEAAKMSAMPNTPRRLSGRLSA